MVDDKIGPIALRDVEHLCAHLDTRRRHGKGPQLESFDLLQILEDRQRLLSGRVVVIDIGDLLALQTATQFVLDELDRRRPLRPIGRSDREQVGNRLPSAEAEMPKPGDVPGILSSTSFWLSACACGVP